MGAAKWGTIGCGKWKHKLRDSNTRHPPAEECRIGPAAHVEVLHDDKRAGVSAIGVVEHLRTAHAIS